MCPQMFAILSLSLMRVADLLKLGYDYSPETDYRSTESNRWSKPVSARIMEWRWCLETASSMSVHGCILSAKMHHSHLLQKLSLACKIMPHAAACRRFPLNCSSLHYTACLHQTFLSTKMHQTQKWVWPVKWCHTLLPIEGSHFTEVHCTQRSQPH